METSESKKKKIQCCVCNKILSKNSTSCSQCFNFTCKHHWRSDEGEKYCDNCIKQKFLIEMNYDTVKTRLDNELNNLREKEKAITEELDLKSKFIEEAENNFKKISAVYAKNISDLEDKIYIYSTDNESNDLLIKRFNSDLIASEDNIKQNKVRISLYSSDISNLDNEINMLNLNMERLQEKTKDLISRNNESVLYTKVRVVTCNGCHKIIKSAMLDQITEIANYRRSSKIVNSLKSVKNSREFRKDSCTKCSVY